MVIITFICAIVVNVGYVMRRFADRSVKVKPRFLTIWRIADSRASGAEKIGMFFSDMLPIYIISIFFMWNDVTRKMLMQIDCPAYKDIGDGVRVI
jgi:hypothetical protein